MLALQTTRTRADFRWCQCACVVDEDRSFLHLLDRAVDTVPAIAVDVADAKLALIDATERGHHAERQGLARHFHAEHADLGLLGTERGVLGNVERESGL